MAILGGLLLPQDQVRPVVASPVGPPLPLLPLSALINSFHKLNNFGWEDYLRSSPPPHRGVGNPPPADHFRFCQRYKKARDRRTAVTTDSTNDSTLQYTAHLAIHFQKPGGRNPLPLRNFQKSRAGGTP